MKKKICGIGRKILRCASSKCFRSSRKRRRHRFSGSKCCVRHLGRSKLSRGVSRTQQGGIYWNCCDSLRELEETAYWLELFVDGKIVPRERLSALRQECDELIAIFVTILKRSKETS